MIDRRGRALTPESAVYRWATLVMSSQWKKASRNYESTTGPGIGVYFVQRGRTLVILLAGGDKRTQERDIKTAIELARGLQE